MGMTLLVAVLGLTAVGLGAVGYVERRRLVRKNETVVNDLLAAAESPRSGPSDGATVTISRRRSGAT
jgi:hypothetical protein